MSSELSQSTSSVPAGGRTRRRRIRFLTAIAAGALAVMAIGAAIASASAPSGVVPTILARGSFDSFKVMSNPANGGLFKAEAKGPIDVVVRRHEYAVNGTTGTWRHTGLNWCRLHTPRFQSAHFNTSVSSPFSNVMMLSRNRIDPSG